MNKKIKKKLKMDDGGTISRPGFRTITRKQGNLTITEEIPESIYQSMQKGSTPQTTPVLDPRVPKALPMPKLNKVVPSKEIQYETLFTPQGKPLYSPKFRGDWSRKDISNAWNGIPDMMHGHEVLKGDSWMDMQTNMNANNPLTTYPGYYSNGLAKMDNGGILGGGVSLNTLPLIQGADALASIMYNGQIRQSEARMMHNQLMPVTSPSNFNGLSSDVVSMGSGGVTMVNQPNALVEHGEVMQTPDGVTQPIYGEKHSDDPNGMGGTLLNLPEETRIFSKKLKLDKEVVSEVLDKKIKKKMSPADLAKKFDTKKYEDVLIDKNADSLSKRTASVMKEHHETKLSHIFDAQEALKSPQNTPSDIQKFGGGGSVRSKYDVSDLDPNTLDLDKVKARFDNIIFPRENMGDMATLGLSPDQMIPSNYNPPNPSLAGSPSASRYVAQGFQSTGNRRGSGLNLGEYAPEAFAALNAISDFPINTAKFQPVYLGQTPSVDISAQLDHNYSAAKGILNRSSGNASVDAARGAQVVANLGEVNNQAFSQKYQSEAQQRFQRNQYNNQLENNANMTNLQRADQFWDKITQRKANKDASLQGVANSAYAKTKAMQMEKESLRVANELYPNYRYNPNGEHAMEYVRGANGEVFHVPIGMSQRGFTDGDGVISTENIYDPRTGKLIRKNRESKKG